MGQVLDALLAPVAGSLAMLGLGLGLARLGPVDRRWMWIAAGYFCSYSLLLEYAAGLPDPFGGPFNWIGKLLGCGFSLFWAALLRLPARETGLVASGTAWTNGVGLVAMLLLASVWGACFADGSRPSVEAWSFQATMPGLDEELAFPGVGLACLLRAFGPRTGRLPAAAVSTLMFALGHGLSWERGGIRLDLSEMLYTAAMGALLVLLRLRSNSVLGPVVAHNFGNLGALGVSALKGA